MTRTMIETDALVDERVAAIGSDTRLGRKLRAAKLLNRGAEFRVAHQGRKDGWLMLMEDMCAIISEMSDEIDRLTPYLDESDQGDDDRRGTA